jgi:hypothetical protein
LQFPIILFGKYYWKNAVNWQFLVDYGTISQSDVDHLLFTDSVDEAYNCIVNYLQKQADIGCIGHGQGPRPAVISAPGTPTRKPEVNQPAKMQKMNVVEEAEVEKPYV